MNPATILYFYPRPGGHVGDDWRSAVPPARHARFAHSTRLVNTKGPDGHRGLLITWQTNVLLQYAPEAQTWRKIGECWVGIRNGYDSAELAKDPTATRHVASGYSVTMADGNDYIIPVALADSPNYQIPWRETLDDRGVITRNMDTSYAAVCAAADALWRHIDNEGQFTLDEAELRHACVNALQVNYNLDLTDCLALGLFSTESYRALIAAVLDLPAIGDILKKKRREVSGTASGGRDASPDIAPPTLTSLSS